MVHCLAGVSRSVCLVLSFLIKNRGYSYDEAYRLVKSRRSIVHFNVIFRFIQMMDLLSNFENLKCRLKWVLKSKLIFNLRPSHLLRLNMIILVKRIKTSQPDLILRIILSKDKAIPKMDIINLLPRDLNKNTVHMPLLQNELFMRSAIVMTYHLEISKWLLQKPEKNSIIPIHLPILDWTSSNHIPKDHKFHKFNKGYNLGILALIEKIQTFI